MTMWVAVHLQFVKNAISMKRNKTKYSKTRYACIMMLPQKKKSVS